MFLAQPATEQNSYSTFKNNYCHTKAKIHTQYKKAQTHIHTYTHTKAKMHRQYTKAQTHKNSFDYFCNSVIIQLRFIREGKKSIKKSREFAKREKVALTLKLVHST